MIPQEGKRKGVYGLFDLDTCPLEMLPCCLCLIRCSIDLNCPFDISPCFLEKVYYRCKESMSCANSWGEASFTMIHRSLFHSSINIFPFLVYEGTYVRFGLGKDFFGLGLGKT
jgi:hypothetical protein